MGSDATVLIDGLRFPECPRWHDGALWFSDMHAGEVYRYSEVGVLLESFSIPGGDQVGGIGWLPDGSLLACAMASRKVYRFVDGEPRLHADLSAIGQSAHEINDMVVDRDGRCYVGEFAINVHNWMVENIPEVLDDAGRRQVATAPVQEGSLMVVEPDGTVGIAATGFRFNNGAVITPDGTRLIVAETFGLRLSEFDLADGKLSNRRIWPIDCAPDGIAEPDTDGNIWVSNPLGGAAELIGPGGATLKSVSAGAGVYAVALGGADGRTLFLCTAGTAVPAVTEEQREGRIEIARVEVGLFE